jgi:hypothetical protein
MADISFQNYLEHIPADRKEAVKKLRNILIANLPQGFEEVISEKSIDYVVPHTVYPKGYHCNPKQPLPFISIVSQKNTLTIHHLGFYASQDLTDWFLKEFAKQNSSKLEMGKGCLKFKKMEQIPFELMGELAKKITTTHWIDTYESAFRNK